MAIIHDHFPALAAFAWQDGYEAFSVSKSQVPEVVEYVAFMASLRDAQELAHLHPGLERPGYHRSVATRRWRAWPKGGPPGYALG